MLVPRAPFIAGKIDLRALLGSMPPELLRQSQAVLREQARRFTISTDYDESDMVNALLHRARNAARGRPDALIGPELTSQ